MAIVFVIPEESGHRKLCIIMNEDMCNVSEKTIMHLMIFFKVRLKPFLNVCISGLNDQRHAICVPNALYILIYTIIRENL